MHVEIDLTRHTADGRTEWWYCTVTHEPDTPRVWQHYISHQGVELWDQHMWNLVPTIAQYRHVFDSHYFFFFRKWPIFNWVIYILTGLDNCDWTYIDVKAFYQTFSQQECIMYGPCYPFHEGTHPHLYHGAEWANDIMYADRISQCLPPFLRPDKRIPCVCKCVYCRKIGTALGMVLPLYPCTPSYAEQKPHPGIDFSAVQIIILQSKGWFISGPMNYDILGIIYHPTEYDICKYRLKYVYINI